MHTNQLKVLYNRIGEFLSNEIECIEIIIIMIIIKDIFLFLYNSLGIHSFLQHSLHTHSQVLWDGKGDLWDMPLWAGNIILFSGLVNGHGMGVIELLLFIRKYNAEQSNQFETVWRTHDRHMLISLASDRTIK